MPEIIREINTEKLFALFGISEIFSYTEFEIGKFLDIIMETLLKLIQADTGSLMLIDENKKELVIKSAVGLSEKIINGTKLKMGERIAGYVAEKGEPLLLYNGLENDPRFKGLDSKREIKSSISVPIKVRNKIIGVMNFNIITSSHIFNEDDLRFMTILASWAGSAIENAKLFQELREKIEGIKEAQNIILQQEKLASIGRFSAALVHELNNPITVIFTYVQMYLSRSKEDDPWYKPMKAMEQATERIKNITNRLLDFSKPTSLSLELCSLNEIIEESLVMIEPIFMYYPEIEIIKNFQVNLPDSYFDREQIYYILSNIVKNACESIEKKGRITISTGVVDKSIYLKISDTGSGIPEDEISKIFDPFYSRNKKRGIGLGLFLVYNMVKAHKGSIQVESKLNKGTTFRIKFPLTEKKEN